MATKVHSAAKPQPGRVEPRISRISRIRDFGSDSEVSIREIRGKISAKMSDIDILQCKDRKEKLHKFL
jgi:hypothetical protein